MHGPRVIFVAATLCALTGACKRTPSPSEPQHEVDPEVNLAELLSATNLSRDVASRGGARIEALTSFHVTPAPGAGDAKNMLGEQNITTNTQLVLNGRGHYLLHEENDQDGGREVIFTGDQIAVKLRYGKLIKR